MSGGSYWEVVKGFGGNGGLVWGSGERDWLGLIAQVAATARLARFVLYTSPLNALVNRGAVQILRTTVRFFALKGPPSTTWEKLSMGLWSYAKIATSISQFLQRKRLGEARERDSASARKSKELVV